MGVPLTSTNPSLSMGCKKIAEYKFLKNGRRPPALRRHPSWFARGRARARATEVPSGAYCDRAFGHAHTVYRFTGCSTVHWFLLLVSCILVVSLWDSALLVFATVFDVAPSEGSLRTHARIRTRHTQPKLHPNTACICDPTSCSTTLLS